MKLLNLQVTGCLCLKRDQGGFWLRRFMPPILALSIVWCISFVMKTMNCTKSIVVDLLSKIASWSRTINDCLYNRKSAQKKGDNISWLFRVFKASKRQYKRFITIFVRSTLHHSCVCFAVAIPKSHSSLNTRYKLATYRQSVASLYARGYIMNRNLPWTLPIIARSITRMRQDIERYDIDEWSSLYQVVWTR